MTNLVTPTIHSNGTDGHELLFQVQRIMASLCHVEEAMHLATPHARDYYPQGSEATAEARKAFSERYLAIIAMLDEFKTLAFAIDAQNEARAERSAA
jgi:hypothetical protein